MENILWQDAFWIVLTGSLVAVSGALLGSYLLLRRQAMIGDAIAHSVLPGIAAAYLLSGGLHSAPALLGAASVGLGCTWLIDTVQRKGGVQNDAAMGLVFTFLFAIGVIMVSAFGGNVDLDQECVLYGELGFIVFDERYWGIPRSTLWLGGNLVLILLVIILGYRGLFLTTFDPEYARATGFSTGRWHYLLMALVSVSAVNSFESVGAILVVAFLTVPAATAHLLSDKLRNMLVLASVFSVAGSLGGYLLAAWLNANIAGAMTVVLGLQFALVFLWHKRLRASAPEASPQLSR